MLTGDQGTPLIVELFSRLARRGQIFDLSQTLHNGMPVLPLHLPFNMHLHRRHGDTMRAADSTFANEVMICSCHTSTHVDALGHFSQNGKVFGGADVDSIQCHEGLSALGIEETPPILRRGLLLDVPGYLQVDCLEPGYAIDGDDLQATADWAGVQPQAGDVLLIRTGWMRHWGEPDRFHGKLSGVPGVGPDGARWVIRHGSYMTGNDTAIYEVAPTRGESVHAMLLVHAGIQIIENLYLEALAAGGVYEFLFIALPLRIIGATGSPIRPIAIC